MNVLSAPPPSPVSSASSGAGDNASARGDGSFAAMMDPGQGPGSAAARPKGNDRPQDAGQAQQRTSRPAKPASTPEPEASPAAATEAATAKADEQAPASGTDTDTAAQDWPPPGLAGLLGLAPPAQPAATGLQMQGEAAPDALLPDAADAGAVLPAPVDPALAPAIQSTATTSPSAALPLAAQAPPTAATPAVQAEPALAEAAAAAVQPNARTAVDPTALQTIDGPDAPAFVLPAAGAAPTSAPTAAAQAPVELPPHLPRPDLQGDAFADEIGTSMRWMADQKIGHAHIRISPQDLGPIEIRLHLDGDRVSADFSSAQPDVRQALEQSIPRLRDMLGQNGFQLSHAGVGHQDGGRQQEGGRAQSGAGDQDGGAADNAPVSARQIRLRGLLDAYA